MRGRDAQGMGYYQAPRGARTHNGVDFVAVPGEPVKAFLGGVVSKLGHPYADKPLFRYVEITRANSAVRYFYVSPSVAVGDHIKPGDVLGTCQELPYHGITQHFHLEIRVGGEFVDPIPYLCNNA